MTVEPNLVKRAVVASRIGRYAAAAAAVLLAAAGQFALARWVGGTASFAVFFPAIVGGALLGAGPGALGLGLSLAVGLAALTWTAGPAAPGGRDGLEFSLLGLSGAIIVLIIDAYRRRRSPFSQADQLFKAVQDISLEGVVVYRALLNRNGQVRDFEYRYANPAACAIMMNPGFNEIVGAKLLERLPLAREHPELYPRYVRVFTTGETSEAEYELGGRWFHSTAAKLDDGLVVTVQDVSERRRGEDMQKLLSQELNHRVKNLLASVIAMANSTERGVTTTAEFRDKLSARLQALSRAHGLLIAGAWTDAAVGDVVQSTLEPYLATDAGRFRIDGPEIRVASDAALALNMALHELATNAIKYGALSDQARPHRDTMGIGVRTTRFRAAELDRVGRAAGVDAEQPRLRNPAVGAGFRGHGRRSRLLFLADGVFCEMRFAGAIVHHEAVA